MKWCLQMKAFININFYFSHTEESVYLIYSEHFNPSPAGDDCKAFANSFKLDQTPEFLSGSELFATEPIFLPNFEQLLNL